jgi:hypothetical protein
MELKSMLEKGLKDMKVSRLADEQIEAPSDDDQYPYGLRLTLNNKELSNLGIDVEKMTVGEAVDLECRANIIALRKDKGGHGNSKSIELQITHVGFESKDTK